MNTPSRRPTPRGALLGLLLALINGAGAVALHRTNPPPAKAKAPVQAAEVTDLSITCITVEPAADGGSPICDTFASVPIRVTASGAMRITLVASRSVTDPGTQYLTVTPGPSGSVRVAWSLPTGQQWEIQAYACARPSPQNPRLCIGGTGLWQGAPYRVDPQNIPNASGPAGSTLAQLRRIVPAGLSLMALPGAQPYKTANLIRGGDVMAVLRSATTGYWVMMATSSAARGLSNAWLWNARADYTPFDVTDLGCPANEVELVNLTGAPTRQQLLTAFQQGGYWQDIRIWSWARGVPQVLLHPTGTCATVVPPATPGGLPGLATWLHVAGDVGIERVWQWDPRLGRFVRADGSFPSFFAHSAVPRAERAAQALSDAPISLYALALAQLQAREDAAAMASAEAGLRASTFRSGLLEIEATVDRRAGRCELAVPLYRQVTAAGRAADDVLSWGIEPRAYYGLALCAEQAGQVGVARVDFQQALRVAPTDGDWYGAARAERAIDRGP